MKYFEENAAFFFSITLIILGAGLMGGLVAAGAACLAIGAIILLGKLLIG